ncbi:MAG: twin-arginine translocase TatA/TatE family subunit [Nitrosopumilus sp.]|nr:twin-arginine translocase TatA/TatE family subunit [Nitrosopumilus sp.]MDH3825440.1 twin-arginine translocase TatA/TatE family subunit [Nitrosopumilus sp.]
MIEHSLNIVGSEWIIIIFVALILFLGTGQLPGAARKIGKVVNQYNQAKNDVQNQLKEVSNDNVNISGPVENERQKNEIIANSFGIRPEGLTDEELRKLIENRIGQKNTDDSKN